MGNNSKEILIDRLRKMMEELGMELARNSVYDGHDSFTGYEYSFIGDDIDVDIDDIYNALYGGEDAEG